MAVRYRNLAVLDDGHRRALLEAVESVLLHGKLLLGPEVEAFESRVAQVAKRKFAVGVSSGSAALYLALRALGIGPGHEVITTALSWIATFNAIALTGATPVAVDVRLDQNINPEAISAAIGPRTRAIVPVHYTGKICDMDSIMAIADQYGLPVVEDAAQVFGGHDSKGRMGGEFGSLASFSMNAMKPFCSYGEAGAIVCDDEALRDRLIELRYNGMRNREICIEPSINGRLDTLQAALLLVNLNRFQDWIDRRRQIAFQYRTKLSKMVCCPEELPGERHCFHTYGVLVEDREQLMAHLLSRGIEVGIHHRYLMPEQPAYRNIPSQKLTVARHLSSRILSLPNHEKMSDCEVSEVIAAVNEFYE